MGVDITMCLIDHFGTIIIDNLYGGRNTEWFDNLMDRRYNDDYDSFHPTSGIPAIVPYEIKNDYENREKYGYYGFAYIPLDKYIEWYKTAKPYLHAGWFSTYDSWRIDEKNYHPDPSEVSRYLPEGANPADAVFKEYIDRYDPNTVVLDIIYATLKDNHNYENFYIIYYFNC